MIFLFSISLIDVKLIYNVVLGYPGATSGKDLLANVGDMTDMGSIPGSVRSSGGGHGNPLQYSSLETLMGRGAWGAAVHRVTKNGTRRKPLSTHDV